MLAEMRMMKQQQQQPMKLPSAPLPSSAATEGTNDLIYKALMDHKKAEMQRMSALASDTRTITEAMLRKQVKTESRQLFLFLPPSSNSLYPKKQSQVEAQRTKLAVSACTQYATNAKYVEVNSGKHPRVRVFPGMHALSPDEVDVYSSLVDKCPSAHVTVMHNHCMSEQVRVCCIIPCP